MDWFTPHNRKYDSQLVSTNKIQPQFASYGQILLQKNSHWCLRQSVCRPLLLLKYRMLYLSWSRKPEFYTIRSHLWHSNFMKDLFQNWDLVVPRVHESSYYHWFKVSFWQTRNDMKLNSTAEEVFSSVFSRTGFNICIIKKVCNSYISLISK